MMKLSFLLLTTLPIACHCTNDAVDLQQRQRNLFFLRRSCRRQVKDCRAELGFDRPPYEEWMEGLAKDDDLYKLVLSAKKVDMMSFVQNAKVQDRKAYRKFRRGNAKDLAEALERSMTDPDSGDLSAQLSQESLMQVVASADTIYGPVFDDIAEFLWNFLRILILPVWMPLFLWAVCDVSDFSICAAIFAVVTFVVGIVYLPIWLPAYGLLYLLFDVIGIELYRCYGEQLQCQFDSLANQAIPLLLQQSAGKRDHGPAAP